MDGGWNGKVIFYRLYESGRMMTRLFREGGDENTFLPTNYRTCPGHNNGNWNGQNGYVGGKWPRSMHVDVRRDSGEEFQKPFSRSETLDQGLTKNLWVLLQLQPSPDGIPGWLTQKCAFSFFSESPRIEVSYFEAWVLFFTSKRFSKIFSFVLGGCAEKGRRHSQKDNSFCSH